MAIRNDFAPGEVLAAADLNDTFGSKLPYSFGTATPTTTENGFLWYDSTGAPSKPTPKFWDGSAFVPFGGKILQIVRATDGTPRTTTSTTYVDVTGLSVTITPQKSDSAILLVLTGYHVTQSAIDGDNTASYQITDNSNNAVSGAQDLSLGLANFLRTGTAFTVSNINIWGWATPATTSAVTYKARFKSGNASVSATMNNGANVAQLFAIEVSA
jgi:hypothetical protein